MRIAISVTKLCVMLHECRLSPELLELGLINSTIVQRLFVQQLFRIPCIESSEDFHELLHGCCFHFTGPLWVLLDYPYQAVAAVVITTMYALIHFPSYQLAFSPDVLLHYFIRNTIAPACPPFLLPSSPPTFSQGSSMC